MKKELSLVKKTALLLMMIYFFFILGITTQATISRIATTATRISQVLSGLPVAGGGAAEVSAAKA